MCIYIYIYTHTLIKSFIHLIIICLTHLYLINIIQFFYRIVQLRESDRLILILIHVTKIILPINYQKIILAIVHSFLLESYWQEKCFINITWFLKLYRSKFFSPAATTAAATADNESAARGKELYKGGNLGHCALRAKRSGGWWRWQAVASTSTWRLGRQGRSKVDQPQRWALNNPCQKKNHPTTTTTTTTPSLLLLSTTKVILSFPDVCSCEFFSLHLYLIVSLDRLSFVCLWVSLLLYLYFAHLTSQIGMSRCLNQFFIVRCVVT